MTYKFKMHINLKPFATPSTTWVIVIDMGQVLRDLQGRQVLPTPSLYADAPLHQAMMVVPPHAMNFLHDMGRPSVPSQDIPPSSPSGPMTRARAKLLHDKVNSLLSICDFDSPLDGVLLHAPTLCILRYDPQDRPQVTQEAGDEKTELLLKKEKNPGVSGVRTPEFPATRLRTSLRTRVQKLLAPPRSPPRRLPRSFRTFRSFRGSSPESPALLRQVRWAWAHLVPNSPSTALGCQLLPVLPLCIVEDYL